MKISSPVILLLRRDLRLFDNLALHNASKCGAVIPVYILESSAASSLNSNGLGDELKTSSFQAMGGASEWWLHKSLNSLSEKFASKNGSLFIQKGDTFSILESLIQQTGAQSVFWNRRYEPDNIKRDTALKSQLKNLGVNVNSYNASLISEPWLTLNKQGLPYKVFSAYWRHCIANIEVATPLPEPESIDFFDLSETTEKVLSIDDLGLIDTQINWAQGIKDNWQPGEDSAQTRWSTFLDENIIRYKSNRDIPATDGTSRLSPHIAFGEISVRQLWHDIKNTYEIDSNVDAACYLSEVGWREFSYYLLYHFPHMVHGNYNSKFDNFNWLAEHTPEYKKRLLAWQTGNTGYPIIDAGMRELWHTGYMHNRVRMVVASFLCKHLMIHWEEGAKWFWDTLVDADLASNTASWQWVAGCGADAAPYFRIFNPTTQGEKFDKKGVYTRRWVPELAKISDKYLYHPWDASADELSSAGIKLGQDYPNPIINHSEARAFALDSYQQLKAIS